MNRGTWIAVASAAAVTTVVGVLAVQAARRDRADLVAAFGDEHLSRLRIAIREIESELAAMGQHLEFAARLVSTPESPRGERRELEALLAVVPSYVLIAVYEGEGQERLVVGTPHGAQRAGRTALRRALAATARKAVERQGMAISEPLGDASAPWLRAFATPFARDGRPEGALVVLVDQRTWFERLRVVAPGEASKLVLFGPYGRTTPLTDSAILAALDGGTPPPALADVRERMRAGHSGTRVIPGEEADALGMGSADAVAVYAPIRTPDAGHWSAALLDSTAPLEAQERAILQRTVALALTLAAAFGALAAYLVLNARRTIAVRERLRTAEQVAHLRAQAEKILENAPVGVLALDEQDGISGANRAAREKLPLAGPGRTLEEALPEAAPETLQALRALVREARAAGAVRRVLEPPLALGPSGTFFTVHAVPLDHPTADLSLLVVLEDVTELRALSSQLLRAEKLATVGGLAAGIAHEVGTPLGVMRGRAELLVQRLGPGHPQGESARVIVEEIDRISRTIRELLDFSRTSREVGGAVVLAEVAEEVADLLSFEARKRKLSIGVEVPRALPPLAANRDQLKQVLVNLVLNALHASAAGGRVAIRADGRPGACLLEVVDHGAGIPADLRHRVFDPFFTTKKRGKGTGLGLTVALQIVRNHGGEIDLESAVGRGTRVRVVWPLATTGKEQRDERPEGRAHLGGG
ncbi:MAG TPA: ATP-binding protein [Anaeromyxobacter sp.]|nr:ATP-binding protein [Anaeromyxobacter sp.]